MAESLGALSTSALATYNYVALEQAANQAAKNPEVLYVIVHDKEGRVAGFSGHPELQGKELSDSVSRTALSATKPLAHDSMAGSDDRLGMEIAFPVHLPGSTHRWGLIRVGLSLATMYTQLRQMTWIIGGAGLLALLMGVTAASLMAKRITMPLDHLVAATIEAAQGNLEPEIPSERGDEVGVLAGNFKVMIQEILRQRQRLENQLAEIRHLQQYQDRLLTTMSDGLLAVDRYENLRTINPAARHMLDLGEDLQGSSIAELLEGSPELLEYLRGAIAAPQGLPQKELHVGSSSGEQVMLASSSTLLDSEATVTEVIANLHDITDLKKLEAKMRQADRLAALGTLAAGMAHEIRNPLSAIKTFVQLLPRKLEKPGFLDKFNRTVPRELERINGLIEDLLELARTPRYRPQDLALGPVLQQNLDLLDEQIRLANVVLEQRIEEGLPPVWVDGDHLAKAFHNLVRNALQAMPAGGRLTVSASLVNCNDGLDARFSPDRIWCAVTFQDTGTGISEEVLPNIFNPFFSTKDSGTGLGLAITHKVVTEHEGFIEVSSELGQGSCFTVYLPGRRLRDTPL